MALQIDIEHGVATVTIDLPPFNLVGTALISSLFELLATVGDDPAVRVLVLCSADPDFFLMHGDVEMMVAHAPQAYVPASEPNVAAVLFDRLSSGRLVTIGLLDGIARGGGCELLSALDLRIGTPRALIGQPEVPLGILPGAGGTARWPRLVGRGRALEIILTGRDVHAEEAYAIGWLDLLVPSADLLTTGTALAQRIASMPAGSIAAVKRVVDATLAPITEALTVESDELARRMASSEARAGLRGFLAAGGQTRASERDPAAFARVVDAVLDAQQSNGA